MKSTVLSNTELVDLIISRAKAFGKKVDRMSLQPLDCQGSLRRLLVAVDQLESRFNTAMENKA